MIELKPIDPHTRFATFRRDENQSGEDRANQLRGELWRMAAIVNSGPDFRECLSAGIPVSYFPEIETNGHDDASIQKYVVSSDLLEVALIACELIKQEQENSKIQRLTSEE